MPEYDKTLWDVLKHADLDDSPELSNKERFRILSIILDVLLFVQTQKCCHLDLKPSNVLINLHEGRWDYKHLVLADFGISSRIVSSDDELRVAQMTHAGTPGFSAPEQFMGNPTIKSDNYSFGKTAVLVLFPWRTAWNLLAYAIKDDDVSPINNHPLEAVISNLLQVSTFL